MAAKGDAGGGAKRNLNGMFDPEVVEAMRRQFDSADKDGNGQLDSREACELFAKHCCPEGAGEEEIRRTASGLMNQLDADRSGTISFDEYCFRFGRRYQVEAARRRRAGQAGGSSGSSATGGAGVAAPEAAGATDNSASASPSATAPSAAASESAPRERSAGRAAEAAAGADAQGASGRAAEAPRAEPSPPPGGGGSQQFAVGSMVALEGLRAAPQLNGKRAKVLRFDAAAGRYVVEIEAGGGQKSLRPENLKVAGASPSGSDAFAGAAATGRRWMQKAKTGLQRGVARIQVMLAEYEWWQIALGAAVVVLFAMAYFQVQGRYRGGGGGGASGRQSRPRPGASQSRYADERWDGGSEGGGEDEPRGGRGGGGGRGDRGGGRHGGRGSERYDDFDEDFDRGGRRPRGRRGSGPGGGGRYYYHEQDDYDDYGHGGGGSGGGGGLLGGEWGQLYTLVVLGGLGYACWTGIIPVHRMSWFQLYMLWNFLEPLLLGGRGRGFGGGFGRRRRGFF